MNRSGRRWRHTRHCRPHAGIEQAQGVLPLADAKRRTHSEVLSSFVCSIRYEDLPSNVAEHARMAVMDTLGASLLGIHSEEGRRVVSAVAAYDGGDQASIWGADRRVSAPVAALVNGTTAHARELDDFGGCGHSAAVVVPAALSLAETLDCDGKRVIAAVVAGYEVASRVMEAAGGYPRHKERGWHSTGTCGSLGAAAAAARTMELDADAMANAIGIAGSFTGGLWAFIVDGAMTKRLHPGKAAENGVVAAYLARERFTGPRAIFEAKWGGFLSSYVPDDGEPEQLVSALGEEFHILRSGFKPHASCRGSHSSIDAFVQILSQERLSPADIERVEVFVAPLAELQLGKRDVQTIVDAQLSIPYCLSVALLFGSTGPGQFTDERIADPDVRSWCQRVTVRGDRTITPGDSRVRVHRRNGTVVEGQVPVAKGAPENPMTSGELEAKFRELAATALPEPTVDELVEALGCLEEVDSFRAVSRLLRRTS